MDIFTINIYYEATSLFISKHLPSDFGFGGGRPSHPELLDWLAEELLRQNWSLKAIHRLILTSDAYMQTSNVKEQVFSTKMISP